MDKICENYKNSLYSGLSKIGKCLSSEKRIEILYKGQKLWKAFQMKQE